MARESRLSRFALIEVSLHRQNSAGGWRATRVKLTFFFCFSGYHRILVHFLMHFQIFCFSSVTCDFLLFSTIAHLSKHSSLGAPCRASTTLSRIFYRHSCDCLPHMRRFVHHEFPSSIFLISLEVCRVRNFLYSSATCSAGIRVSFTFSKLIESRRTINPFSLSPSTVG